MNLCPEKDDLNMNLWPTDDLDLLYQIYYCFLKKDTFY